MMDAVAAAMEPAYLAYPIAFTGLDPVIFESNIVAHFVVHRPSWPFAIVLTPKVLVRMFNEESVPVKSPSYMPRLEAYFWFQNKLNGDQPAPYVSLGISHHSNGQALSFFDDQGNIRHEGGSFQTNYLELAGHLTGNEGRLFGWTRLALEWHLGFWANSELRGRYGLVRAHLASTVLSKLPLQGQLNVELTAILDGFLHTTRAGWTRALERFPLSLRYSITVPGFQIALYAGYYVGHDYYNIYFDRFVHMFQLGISSAMNPAVLTHSQAR